MIEKEALEDFKETVKIIDEHIDDFVDEYKQHMLTSKEHFEVAIQAIEKQIPKKPDSEKHNFMGWKCPACNMPLGKIMGNYCHHCGTKLDWSEEE